MDTYSKFAELKAAEEEGVAFRIVTRQRSSPVIVLAPHGGGIEPGTSAIAEAVAADDFNLYLFEGLKKSKNRHLHITSHRFDEPTCLEMLQRCTTAIAIHGCSGNESRICLGGLDEALLALVRAELLSAKLPVAPGISDYPAKEKFNICNRTADGRGVQVEISLDLRSDAAARATIVGALRVAVKVDAQRA